MIKTLEKLLEWGGLRRDVAFLVVGGVSLLASIFCPDLFWVNPAWLAVIFCGLPIILEAVVGLVTAFDIKADVLVSIALVASAVHRGGPLPRGKWPSSCSWGALLEEADGGPCPCGHREAGASDSPHGPGGDAGGRRAGDPGGAGAGGGACCGCCRGRRCRWTG